MKTLFIFFGLLGILLLINGLVALFTYNQPGFFGSFGLGMLCTSLFLYLSNEFEKKN